MLHINKEPWHGISNNVVKNDIFTFLQFQKLSSFDIQKIQISFQYVGYYHW